MPANVPRVVHPNARLTYCGNVHAADDVAGWIDGLTRWAAPIAAGRLRPFGLGVWWSAAVAAELRRDGAARARAADALRAHDLEVWTCNAFPSGRFHGAAVKTAVYTPDWSREERLQFTRDVAEVAAALAPRGAPFPISTLPLGYGELDLRLCARNLARAASALADLEQRTGLHCVLALEPEPCCALETVAQGIAFFEQWLLRPGAWTVPEATLRRHLGLCVDLCHLAVLREDPLRAIDALAAAGIQLAKIQVSACLELRDPAQLPRLLRFDEPVYLHQTVADRGPRALDLGDVAQRAAEFQRAGRLRTHFHVPVGWDDPGPLGSTRAELERVLAGLRAPLPLLEVETYTWGVLPEPPASDAALIAGIREELDFVRSRIPR